MMAHSSSKSWRHSNSTNTGSRQSSSTTTKASSTTCSSSGDNNNIQKQHKTIALFGAGSTTTSYFLKHALDAGYHVRALLILSDYAVSSPSTFQGAAAVKARALQEEFQQETLQWVRAATVHDGEMVASVLEGADYVVCMLNNDAPLLCEGVEHESSTTYNAQKKKKKRQTKEEQQPLTSFLRLLYPLMRQEDSIQVFLFQANSLAIDARGKTPIFSRVMKMATVVGDATTNAIPGLQRGERSRALQDQDSAVYFITQQHRRLNHMVQDSDNDENNEATAERPHFAYIVTRPSTLLKEGPATRKLMATKSLPGPFPVTHCDLAEFSLNALLNEKLFNTLPYVD